MLLKAVSFIANKDTAMQKKLITRLFNQALAPILIALLTATSSPAIYAKTAYITDSLRVEMRSGATREHRIITYIRSGTPVEIIEEYLNNDWVKVRVRGREGYVLKSYLVDEPVAKDQLAKMQRTINSTKASNQEQSETIASLQQELRKLKQEFKTGEANYQNLTSKYDKLKKISSNAVKLDEQNRMLLEKQEKQKIELEQLTQDNIRLKDDQYIDGLLYGIGAVFLGALLAMLAPRLQVNKRKSDW